jgi:hypothetical protein
MLFTVTSAYRLYSPPMVFLDLRFLQQQLKSGGGPGFVYIIYLLTYESNIVIYLSTLYLYVNASFHHRNNT